MTPIPASRLALLLGAVLACGGDNAPTVMDAANREMSDASGGVAAVAVAPAEFRKSAEPQAAPPPRVTVQDSTVSSMVIRNGSATIKVDSLEPAITALRELAGRLGGSVGNISVSGGENQVRSASVELRIPSPRFDDAMTGLSPLGKVESSQATAEDVGEEYVDLTARMNNSRRLEERLIALLANRTGKLEDVLAVERELARVREEIERVEGRMRYLRTRVAMSTVSVYLHEPAPLVGSDPGTGVIAQAFRNMWRNFVMFIATGISWLGVIVPVVALVAAGSWWLRRRSRPRTP